MGFFSHVNRYIRCVQIRVLQEHELLQQVKLIARTQTHPHTHTHTHGVRAVSTWMDYILSLTPTGCETRSSRCENRRHFTACLVYMFDLACLNTPQVLGVEVEALIKADRDQLA